MNRQLLKQYQPLLFFDGVCNLCNHSVQFILRHERDHQLHFETLQSSLGQEVSGYVNDYHGAVDSLLLYAEDEVYYKSAAVFRLARHLRWPYRVVYWLHWLPSWLADPVYDLVARFRYHLFGKRDQCMLPQPEYKSRFLSGTTADR